MKFGSIPLVVSFSMIVCNVNIVDSNPKFSSYSVSQPDHPYALGLMCTLRIGFEDGLWLGDEALSLHERTFSTH
jgi:hypothetical protein